MIPAISAEAYRAARHAAATIERRDRGRIVLSGKDRASYLQGLLTNDIAALEPGRGCYAAYLTPQGRMITDLWVYELGDAILLVLPREVKDDVAGKLDQFVFAEEVQVRDATDEFAAVAVVGPDAAAAIRTACGIVGADVLASIAQPGGVRTTIRGRQAIVLRISDTGEAGFELLVPPGDMSAVREALASAGAVELDEATAEAIRIESGIPRFHRDMDEETIPLEAGIESTAISFTKGCYVGQEVVVRVLHRGHGRVARRLVGLVFDAGGVVSPGAPVKVDGRDIGQVTSATWSPALDRTIALAYVHRELVNPGTSVEASGLAAHVAALPFVPLRAPVSE